jgi:hypothetical protein
MCRRLNPVSFYVEKPSTEPKKDEVPEASDDDERTECADGTGCGMRFNTLHRGKYKHLRPTPVAGSRSAGKHFEF